MTGCCLDCGKPIDRHSKRCLRCANRGSRHHAWNGGKKIRKRGYISILCPTHPFADKQGYVLEHRLIMEAHVGRVLLPSEVVHHINADTSDNRVENLMLFMGQGDHLSHHAKLRNEN
jgi:hypothetical protein